MKVSKSNQPQMHPTAFAHKSIHILDGGIHGRNIRQFTETLVKDLNVEVNFHNVAVNSKSDSVKQLADLEKQLRYLNNSDIIKKNDYVTIPGMVSVPILNLVDRVQKILHKSIAMNASNIKNYKNVLMALLSNLYYMKDEHAEQIRYMDDLGQNIENTFGVIQEANRLVQKGAHVYIPAGHPDDNAIKWLSGQRQQKEELYKAIATNEYSPKLQEIINEVRRNGWYNLNLLALADAHIVNIDNPKGEAYLFASRDGFVNDRARGVYNLTPVRDNYGKIKGYSFRDEHTVEYPYEKFPENDKIENINKFVGLGLRDVIADSSEQEKFRRQVQQRKTTEQLPDKLYRISDVYEQSEIDRRKLNLLGGYISKDQKLVFDVNSDDKVLFQKCNCEGSSRPSVRSIWGCCYSTISAIGRDIQKSMFNQHTQSSSPSVLGCVMGGTLSIASSSLLTGFIAGFWGSRRKIG